MSSTVRTPPPTVSGMKQRSAVRTTTSKITSRSSWRGRDVEEAELVGARRVVGGRGLDGIAGIDEVDEVHAFDDAAVLDVEAGNDAGFEHGIDVAQAAARNASASLRVDAAIVERAAGDGTFEHSILGPAAAPCTSSIEARPPEAMTGILVARASSAVAGRLRPFRMPSRSMSV